MLKIQAVFIYTFTAIAKMISDPAWIDGSAVYLILADPNWSRWPGLAVYAATFPVSELLTYATLGLEGSFIFLIWRKKYQRIVPILLTVFHLSLAVLMNSITFFSLAMICLLSLWFDFDLGPKKSESQRS